MRKSGADAASVFRSIGEHERRNFVPGYSGIRVPIIAQCENKEIRFTGSGPLMSASPICVRDSSAVMERRYSF